MEGTLKEVLSKGILKKKKANWFPNNLAQVMVKTANQIEIDEITVKMIQSRVENAKSLTKSSTCFGCITYGSNNSKVQQQQQQQQQQQLPLH